MGADYSNLGGAVESNRGDDRVSGKFPALACYQ
jgi:hypothetical protein